MRIRNNRVYAMLTLYSYPELFGVADNNGYGLKVFTFLRLCGVPFRHEHIVDTSAAPRGQLPYITDDGETIGDSDTIIAFLIRKYRDTRWLYILAALFSLFCAYIACAYFFRIDN